MKQQIQEKALKRLRDTFVAKKEAEAYYRKAVVDHDYRAEDPDAWTVRYNRAKRQLASALEAMLEAQQEVLGDDLYGIF